MLASGDAPYKAQRNADRFVMSMLLPHGTASLDGNAVKAACRPRRSGNGVLLLPYPVAISKSGCRGGPELVSI